MTLLLVLLALAVALRYLAGARVRAVLEGAARWALIIGGIGFAAGFVGPMIFIPGANQGPMLGIFITGPLGFVVGLVFGVGRSLYLQVRESRSDAGRRAGGR